MKKNNKKAESLAWIIIWVFILAIISLGIGSLIMQSRDLIKKYETKNNINLLSSNSSNIINKLDLSSVPDNEVFYLYKNKSSKNYEIKIWEVNSDYKYVNKLWEKIDTNYPWEVFMRYFYVKKFNQDWVEKTAVRWIIKKLNKWN